MSDQANQNKTQRLTIGTSSETGNLIKGLVLAIVCGGAATGGTMVSNESVVQQLHDIKEEVSDVKSELREMKNNSAELRDRVTRLETRFEYERPAWEGDSR